MAVYLGNGEKLKINLGNSAYNVNLFFVLPTIDEIILSSSDDCLLKDFNELYLTPKEEINYGRYI